MAVVDYNGIQSYGSVEEVMNLDPLCGKWHSFGWAVVGVDGHDVRQLLSALEQVPMVVGKPTCVVARTVKGKGVSFMEGRLEWHYRHASAAELRTALAEVGGVE